MRKFIIEREIPAIGNAEPAELQAIARKSNEILHELTGRIRWLHSYVAAHKTFCVYLAVDEAVIRMHAEMSGFPADKITEISGIITPQTAD
jgi:hypothetical protein